MISHFKTPAKLLLILVLIVQSHSSYARGKKQDPPVRKDSSTHVLLNTKILVNTKNTVGSYRLEVLYRDIIINSFTVKNNSPVRLLLKKDSPYVIKISKKGYIPRFICINTNMHEKTNKSIYYLNLETEFIAASAAMTLDDEALQLPSALVSYNKKAGNFENNKDYSLFVLQRIYAGK
ncbi:hypothetical protein CNR22_05955 [Sphingobacteriaceae bacterium]|nr:hypothetical protein CNR22_05955 [Sphingobacteriaceae bacterium]